MIRGYEWPRGVGAEAPSVVGRVGEYHVAAAGGRHDAAEVARVEPLVDRRVAAGHPEATPRRQDALAGAVAGAVGTASDSSL